MEEQARLHAVDWAVFALMLVISLAVGVFYACTGGKQRTKGEYLMGNREMKLIPVTLSFIVSFISGNSIIGNAAEAYSFGAQVFVTLVGITLGIIWAVFVFVPLFYPLKLVSVNEYLLLRFESRLVLTIGSILTIVSQINIIGVVVYTSSIATEAVSGFSARACIMITCAVVTIYTSIGGLKAVIWSDVFQSLIILIGVVAVLITGVTVAGGLTDVMRVNRKWNRLILFDWDPDPTKRLNVYGLVFGNAFTSLGVFGFLQPGVQRFSSLPTIQQARMCVFGVIPGFVIIGGMGWFTGLVVFAYYAGIGCDPLKAGIIRSPNMVLSYFVVQKITVPGLSGLLLAAITAASLSSASSSLNAAAANTWEDFLKHKYTKMQEARVALILKLIVVIYGVIATLVALAITFSGGIINQIVGTVSSFLQGPAAGLFFMGAFVPWVNWKGASAGSIIGCCFGIWVAIGSFYTEKSWRPLPSTTSNCSSDFISNVTSMTTSDLVSYTTASVYATNSTIVSQEISKTAVTGVKRLYSLSYLWMREAVTGVTMGTALIISLFTGFRDPKTINPVTLHPFVRKFVKFERTTAENEDLLKSLSDIPTEKKAELTKLDAEKPPVVSKV